MTLSVRSPTDSERPALSICIATYNRCAYIGQTLEAVLNQLPAGVEVVIVDGGSSDNTAQVIEPVARQIHAVRYFREATNSGVDRDFDKAVCYARGEYCWLMSDDDVLVPGAVARVIEQLEPSLDLLVVNSRICNADLSVELSPRALAITSDRRYDAESANAFLSEIGDYLSYIGGVVIRQGLWLARERQRYFGSEFIHIGVIFQAPLSCIKILADPLIVIRYGNATWSARGFEIWMFKWPSLIWSFSGLSDTAKKRVVAREPWRRWRRLTFYRAIGAYSYAEYRKFFIDQGRTGLLPLIIALLPAVAVNALTVLYWFLVNRNARAGIYDLARSRNARALTRLIARRLGIPTQ